MKKLLSALIALGVLIGFSFMVGWDQDVRGAPQGIPIDSDDIGGQVHVKKGSPVGVWVIAQADIANTNYRKIVVTNWRGQFVIPDLPDATYDVWVRGYGLKDSPIVKVSPGNKVQLRAELASTPQEAAEAYPANFWYALLEPPAKDMFPGTMTEDDPGNGIPADIESQAQWVNLLKRGSCFTCHQVGNKHTRGHDRDLPQLWDSLWRLTGGMNSGPDRMGREVAKQVYADWAARISEPDEENEIGTLSHKGEVPPEPPLRPGTRIERSIVITQWDWGDGLAYAHDEVSTDKRNPTLYPNGKVWGADIGLERVLFADPVTNEVGEFQVPFLPGFFEAPCDAVSPLDCFTLPAYGNINGPHNPMLDDQGRLWVTHNINPGATEADQPDFCTDGSRGDIPLPNPGGDDIPYFDTVTEEFVLIHACQSTHHLQFDKNGILWLSSPGGIALQWFDPSKFDPNDIAGTNGQALDWREVKVDSDGDGVADTNIAATGQQIRGGYGIIPNPVDGSIWLGNSAGNIVRFDPATEKFEVYEPPTFSGDGARGIDADTEGNVWTCLQGSGHVAKFDRSQCAQTFGTGDQCQEGWTLWELPGPHFKGVPEPEGNADASYYAWVDQFNTLGLGENMVVCTGSNSDSQIAFNPETEEFTIIRTPFPRGMFTRGLDGRIDDPDAGWKGRGWWLDNGNDPIKHLHHEDRHHVIGWVQQVQLRPHPLAH